MRQTALRGVHSESCRAVVVMIRWLAVSIVTDPVRKDGRLEGGKMAVGEDQGDRVMALRSRLQTAHELRVWILGFSCIGS
jgi:hypothetical protein